MLMIWSSRAQNIPLPPGAEAAGRGELPGREPNPSGWRSAGSRRLLLVAPAPPPAVRLLSPYSREEQRRDVPTVQVLRQRALSVVRTPLSAIAASARVRLRRERPKSSGVLAFSSCFTYLRHIVQVDGYGMASTSNKKPDGPK